MFNSLALNVCAHINLKYKIYGKCEEKNKEGSANFNINDTGISGNLLLAKQEKTNIYSNWMICTFYSIINDETIPNIELGCFVIQRIKMGGTIKKK